MNGEIVTALIYALFPIAMIMLSGVVAVFHLPSLALRNAIRYFAAGVIFYTVVVELLPVLVSTQGLLRVIIILAIGAGAMISIRWLTRKLGQAGERGSEWPTVLIANVTIDLLIVGYLAGISFAIAGKELLILSTGLSMEVFSLGVDVTAALSKTGTSHVKSIITTSLLAVPVAAGAIIGTIISFISAAGQALTKGLSGPVLESMLTFGLVGLLYFIAEDLFTAARKDNQAAWKS